MNSNTYKLDITPGGIPLVIHISQYDAGLRQYTFEPYTSVGEFSYVPDAVVTLEATKPDGYMVVQECVYNQDGSITYLLQDQLAAKAGKVRSKIVIRDGSYVLGTGIIIWVVDEAGVTDDAIMSDSDLSGLAEFERQVISLVGTPIAVTLAEEMNDINKIYLYTGSESGYNNGNWYYWDGITWVSGGTYGSDSSVTVTDDGAGTVTITIL